MSDVTQILSKIESGDQKASEELLPLVYNELRQLAAARMANERVDHTLQATALVHEAYLRLVDVEQAQRWDSSGHFFSAAAEAMRRILIEQARRKAGPTAGGDHQRVDWSELELVDDQFPLDLLALDEALQRLAEHDPRSVEVVKLRFYAGLTIDQTAAVLGISPSTVKSDWLFAKSWLRAELIAA
jgi:RNA polymerase sigma factor (TIGR02999 family)